jgi:phosphohistidine phosphatase
MRLYLVRHAEAAPGDPDGLRPLTERGREQARRLGEQLAREGVRPDAVLASPLLRARQTAATVARALGSECDADDRLAPGATPEQIVAAASGRGNTVVVVGHQPDCGLAVAALAGDAPDFPPAGMAVIDL